MRTPNDALRSVKRYVAEWLPEWEVRLAAEEGTFHRPFVRVGMTGALSVPNSRPGTMDYVMPIFAHCYPDRAVSAEDAVVSVNALAASMLTLFTGGEHPYRVPLWDYDGVTLDRGAESRGDRDFLRLTDVQADVQVDTQDHHLTFVAVDLRAAWRQVPYADPRLVLGVEIGGVPS